jgi:hypothetical protein
MSTTQRSLRLLNDPIAQELLRSNSPARLAYVWPDGRPALYQSGITGMAQVLYLRRGQKRQN